jgi:hypothetical protein
MDTTLTPQQAFRAMFLFLDGYWSRVQDGDVGGLAPRGRGRHALGGRVG